MDPTSALGPQLEEALKRMRARGIPGRSRSYQFGTQFAARCCASRSLASLGPARATNLNEARGPGAERSVAARFAADLLKCEDEPPDLTPDLREEAVREWGGKNQERLDLAAFRMGFYVEMLKAAAREWEERAEAALGGADK